MKKRIEGCIGVILLAVVLFGCGNKDSKVDQVIQNQIQIEDNNSNSSVNSESNAPAIKEIPVKRTDENENNDNSITASDDDSIDVDLTILSSTMIYSEVYNMMCMPENYIGKTVKMNGMFVVYTNEDQSMFYPAVIIEDATACCSQGLEFVVIGNPPYPDGYPEIETNITVIGTFETYLEDGNKYCRLQNATILE